MTAMGGDVDKLFIRMGNLTRADGSAIVSKGDTTIQVGLFGPSDLPMHKELPDKATVDVVLKSASRSKETKAEDKTRREFIRSVIESVLHAEFYPKSMIQCNVQELESDGVTLSHAINGSCAALLDSGLSMKSSMAAVTIAIKSERIAGSGGKTKQTLISNPTSEDFDDASGVITLVFESTSDKIIGIHTDKPFCPGMTTAQLNECLIKGRKEAKTIFKLYRDTCSELFR